MISALSLGFTEPLVLTGLITLPALWWLLRLIPPRPRRIDFPPTRLLFAIAPREETPARTPWWLTLLRLALAALIIIAAAGPLWHPPLTATKTGAPLAILLDDGWTAASTWEARLRSGAAATVAWSAEHFIGERRLGAGAAAANQAGALSHRPQRDFAIAVALPLDQS